MASGYLLTTHLLVGRDLDSTFAFFADAGNLERITPPWLRFEVLTPRPVHMRRGTLIDYRLRMRGLPMRWQSEIEAWEPPVRFVDTQRQGPYRLWRHTHLFRAVPEGTLVEDRVEYRAPFGALAQALIVGRDLRRIFTYRQHATLLALGVAARHPVSVAIARADV